jgi:hypothetical protein
MNSSFGIDKTVPIIALLVVCALIGGSFWGAFQIARRMVENPAALILLTLLFGAIITVVVAGGLVAGCYFIMGVQ